MCLTLSLERTFLASHHRFSARKYTDTFTCTGNILGNKENKQQTGYIRTKFRSEKCAYNNECCA